MKPHSIRKPSEYEVALFARLTELEYPGRDVSKRQLEQCQVGLIDEDGSLRVHTTVQEKASVLFSVPVEAVAKDSDGVAVHFVLHVVNGLVHELEIYKDDGSPIRSMPPAKELDLIVYPIEG